jgi:hypothetical protein
MGVGRLSACVAAALVAAGCGARVPVPPSGPHDADNPQQVPYPPPTVRAEIIPPAPAGMKSPRWIDGQWAWHPPRWAWEPGRWEEWSNPRAWYAPPALVVLADGTMWWLAGTRHEPAPPPAPTGSAATPR